MGSSTEKNPRHCTPAWNRPDDRRVGMLLGTAAPLASC